MSFSQHKLQDNLFEILYKRSYLIDIVNIQKIQFLEHPESNKITSYDQLSVQGLNNSSNFVLYPLHT